MDIGVISVRYARALLKSATDAKIEQQVYAEMQQIAKSYIEVPQLRSTIDNPMLSKDKKEALLLTAAGKEPSNLMKAFRDEPRTPIMKGGKVAVVGGGNVAMDAARTALRLGAEKVYIVYRRSMEELPARAEEVEHAIEEGIDFRLLNNPVEILGYNNPDDPRDPKNGFVRGMRCIKMELGEPDASGRRRPVPIPGSEFELDVDAVIMALGTSPNPLIKNTTEGLEVNRKGGIIVDEAGLTSREAVFAGGDAVTGAATVISAMGAGKLAAASIDKMFSGK